MFATFWIKKPHSFLAWYKEPSGFLYRYKSGFLYRRNFTSTNLATSIIKTTGPIILKFYTHIWNILKIWVLDWLCKYFCPGTKSDASFCTQKATRLFVPGQKAAWLFLSKMLQIWSHERSVSVIVYNLFIIRVLQLLHCKRIVAVIATLAWAEDSTCHWTAAAATSAAFAW